MAHLPSNDTHLIWHEIARKKILDAKVFQVYTSRRRSQEGKQRDYALVEAGDWCHVIVPVESEGRECFVMARQFRHGLGAITIEFPGGIVDPGEEPAHAARRELEEETGYRCEKLTLIGRTNSNPAFMTNTVHTFVAHGAERVSEQSLDENELVDIELVPVRQVLSLANPDFTAHAIMLAGLHWYRVWKDDGLAYEERLGGEGADRIRTGE
ncbi:MAG: NUDIX hydrolase [Spirochaetales bacterium]